MTHLFTRRTLVAALATAGSLVFAACAHAQGPAPSKPVRLIVPYLAGGATDVMARHLAHVMTKQLGQQIVVENRPGGNTMIATQHVATSPADGHTLLLSDLSMLSYHAYLYKQPPYDLGRDFMMVS